MHFMRFTAAAAAAAIAAGAAPGGAALAGSIVAPVAGTASSTFAPAYDIARTWDQSGLSIPYTVGDDFDAYLALNPLHSLVAETEWFSALNSFGETVTWDLGAVYDIDRMALWHEDSAGFTDAEIFISVDDVTYTPLTSIAPAHNPISVDYLAEVFTLAASFRYIAWDITGCPQPPDGSNQYCAIGEVIFERVEAGAEVPLPAAAPLMLAGLAGIAALRRRAAG